MASARALCGFSIRHTMYDIQHCFIELQTPLYVYKKHSTLFTDMYSAYVVHSVLSVSSSMNISCFMAWITVLTICNLLQLL